MNENRLGFTIGGALVAGAVYYLLTRPRTQLPSSLRKQVREDRDEATRQALRDIASRKKPR